MSTTRSVRSDRFGEDPEVPATGGDVVGVGVGAGTGMLVGEVAAVAVAVAAAGGDEDGVGAAEFRAAAGGVVSSGVPQVDQPRAEGRGMALGGGARVDGAVEEEDELVDEESLCTGEMGE